ncbi:HET-domain-containing protein [Cucurbitaria berberidis CBS 394.84]|uniref:HET-domain-containing protein n=1 Tax=Cucurbitaria berberidis CBS 394.84 TaxID=1168544 RepID=A0A9P4LEC7_9PLEO|nr:HET-domain-containing protein [Cucurbitaria berberidis CBS 394.84]KAF1851242.1 HET-domain-containing protein [Cucurbitaria berberidis CBS 394.84]
MRLLNAKTYRLKTQLGRDKPAYAILSHTWEEDEVLYKDLKSASETDWGAKKGFSKIKHACDQALKDGYDFIWIDTCCINKDSSAGLSEAINSMFTWYQEASICYAYLSDAQHGSTELLIHCHWFGRGWTLQEMIAPDHVHFYDNNWIYLGSRTSLALDLKEATGIDETILVRGHLDQKSLSTYFVHEGLDTTSRVCKYCGSTIKEDVHIILSRVSIARRMKWASKRATTRVEDVAYCLMGLFDVNMPLLYGEGEKAFFRLQEQILKSSRDHSILAFRADPSKRPTGRYDSAILAPHPSYFRDDIQREWMHAGGNARLILSEGELMMDMLICPLLSGSSSLNLFRGKHIGILDCMIGNDYLSRPAILLEAIDKSARRFRRCPREPLLLQLKATESSDCILLNQYTDRDPVEKVQYDARKIRRLGITISFDKVPDRDGPGLGLPLRLNSFSADSPRYFTMGIASPAFIADYIPNIKYNHVGIISFYSYKFEHFFIAWGRLSNSGADIIWCRIWTLSQILRENLLDLDWTPQDKEVVEEIVRSVELRRPGSLLLQPHRADMCDTDDVFIGTANTVRLRVTVKISKATFINRSVYQMNVRAGIAALKASLKHSKNLILVI